MIASVTFEKSTWNELPYKFEAGTPNIAGAIALGAAIDWVERRRARRDRRPRARAARATGPSVLSEIPGLRLDRHRAATRRASSPSCSTASTPTTSGTILDYEGIAVRTGHHCAQPVMDRFGVPATTRASLACFNTRARARRPGPRDPQGAGDVRE